MASWTGCATGAEPLVVQAGGIVTQKQTVTVGSDTATVYTYVTDTYIGCSTALGNCSAAAGDARRVVVAVLLGNGGPPRHRPELAGLRELDLHQSRADQPGQQLDWAHLWE